MRQRLHSLRALLPELWREGVARAYALTTTTALTIIGLLPAPAVQQHKLQIIVTCFLVLSAAFLIYRLARPQKYLEDAVNPQDLTELAEIRVVHDSEAIAERSNRLARAHFGKAMGFSYEKYRGWRRKNRKIFAAFLKDGALLGFVDVFPLLDSAGAALLNGDRKERDLGLADLLDEAAVATCNYVHVASVVSVHRSPLVRCAVEHAALSYIDHVYPPRPGRIYTAIPLTEDGERVLTRVGFKKWLSGTATDAGNDVYQLPSEEIESNGRLAKLIGSMQIRLTEESRGGEWRIQVPPRARRRLARRVLANAVGP